MNKTTPLLLTLVSLGSLFSIHTASAAPCSEVAAVYNASGIYHCDPIYGGQYSPPQYSCSGGGSHWTLIGSGTECAASPAEQENPTDPEAEGGDAVNP